jgi:carboxylesterase type B
LHPAIQLYVKPLFSRKKLTTAVPEASRNFTMEVFNNPPPEESEDCLYLNVYAPSKRAPPRAVMVWIYGGALQFGSAGLPVYDGSSFAAYEDVIVVAANYRTNGEQPHLGP